VEPATIAVGFAAAAVAALATASVMLARRHLLRARRAEAELVRLRWELQLERHAAGHDPLTGLPNRRTFYCSGSPLVADATRRPLVAVLVDLDDFKRVNDTLGHAVGDRVLVEVARRFAGIAGGGLVARLGGDEFAGLLDWPTTDDRWLRRSAYVLAAELAAPVQVAGRGVAVTASVGLTPVPAAADLDDVLSRADAAMYQAKTTPGRAFIAGADDQQAWQLPDPAQPHRATDQPPHVRTASPTPLARAGVAAL
jgi:diguanylate cyclase (GGDEF)-like protein